MTELSDNEHKIIAAASREFIEKGLSGARMQVIADLAGINKAMLHYYFRSKEKLYEFVAEREVRRFFGQIHQLSSPEGNFRDWLEQFIGNYIQTLSQHPQLTRFLLWEIESGGKMLSGVIKETLHMQGGGQNPIFRMVSRAVAEGVIRPISAEHFMISLLGACVYPFIARPILENLIPGLQINSHEFVEQRKKEVLDLIWNGLQMIPSGTLRESSQQTLPDRCVFW